MTTTYTACIGRIRHTYDAVSDAHAIAVGIRVAAECRGEIDRVIKHDGSPSTDLPADDVMFARLTARWLTGPAR